MNDIIDKYQLILIYFVAAVMFAMLKAAIRTRQTKYAFYFCDGSRQKIISVELVSSYQYQHYDMYYQYPVLHITSNAVYFLVS